MFLSYKMFNLKGRRTGPPICDCPLGTYDDGTINDCVDCHWTCSDCIEYFCMTCITNMVND